MNDYEYLCSMKHSKHLDGYLLEANGNVIEESTGMIVEPIEHNEYKLLTTETFYSTLKKKDIQLWRRFSKDQLIKMYEQGYDVEVTKPSKILTNTQAEESVQVGTSTPPSSAPLKSAPLTGQVEESAPPKHGTSAPVSINGVEYSSIRVAAEALSINRRTIKKRLDDESNKAYYYV